MDFKKILIISLVLVAIFASLSVASAGLFDGLFGSEDQNVTIEGENFTIPGGYEENQDESKNVYANGINETYKEYDDFADYISITIDVYDSEDDIKDIAVYDSTVNKTICNKTGYFNQQGDIYSFSYIHGKKLVTIGTSDESNLEKVLA